MTAKRSYAKAKLGEVIDAGAGPTPQSLVKAFAEVVPAEELVEVHSMAPWWIVQVRPNGERIACEALVREGFEAWYPTRRVYTEIPLRKLPSKTRHKRRRAGAMNVTVEPIYPGWVFIRRLFGQFGLLAISDLKGCIGICLDTVGEDGYRPSELPDYWIEQRRVAEAKGTHDEYRGVSPAKALMAELRYTAKAMKQYNSTGRVLAKLDESSGTSLFIAHLDRIIRVSRIADRAALSGPSLGGTTPRVDCVPSTGADG